MYARESVSARERSQPNSCVHVVVAVAFVMPFTLSDCLAGNCKCVARARYATTQRASQMTRMILIGRRTHSRSELSEPSRAEAAS